MAWQQLPEKLVSKVLTAVLKSIIFTATTLVYVKPVRLTTEALLAFAAKLVSAAASSVICAFFTAISEFKFASV